MVKPWLQSPGSKVWSSGSIDQRKLTPWSCHSSSHSLLVFIGWAWLSMSSISLRLSRMEPANRVGYKALTSLASGYGDIALAAE